MTCEDLRRQVDDAVDGELDAGVRWMLDAHAAACQACARRLEFQRRLKVLVARRGRSPEPPAYLAEKVRRAVEQARDPRPPRHRLPVPTLAAAVLAVVGVLAWAVLRPGGPEPGLAEALARDHASYLAKTDAAQVQSNNPRAIETWFRGKLPFDLRLPELAAVPAGARVCRVLDRRCALVFYEKDGRRLSLFAFGPDDFQGPMPDGVREGHFTVIGWREGGGRYAVVSDLEPAEAERLRDR